MTLIDKNSVKITNSNTIIDIMADNNGWERYITIEGEKAYYIGTTCGTCRFYFERLNGANQNISPNELSNKLRHGLDRLDNDIISIINNIMPNGEYICSLQTISPKLVELSSSEDYFTNEQIDLWGIDKFWGLPHNPKIRYYRGITEKISESSCLFEFIVPIYPQNWLEADTVKLYQELIKINEKPTALAISILDVKQPGDWDNQIIDTHYCLTHYLLDGHHKVFASSLEEKEITMVSYIALGKGISDKEDVNKILDFL